MPRSVTTLDDKYLQSGGRVFISSNQALVRLPLDQARRDRAAGLNTAGYISGYRGSPLGVYDSALWGAQKLLDQHHVVFRPGLDCPAALQAAVAAEVLPPTMTPSPSPTATGPTPTPTASPTRTPTPLWPAAPAFLPLADAGSPRRSDG